MLSNKWKITDFMQQSVSVKYIIHELLSHKMALALCAQLADLSVLKLSLELHGGGTGNIETHARILSWYRLDFHLATHQPIVI